MSILKNIIFILFSVGLLSSCEKDPPAPLAIADFFVENSACISDCYVKVYDQSYNAERWSWDFGNGSNSSSKNDSTLFVDPGFYDIKLTVWNEDDVSDEIIKTITIY
jgi:PKD repeat protein